MLRTAASTSAELSRLPSRKARNFCAKSAERVSRRIAMVCPVGPHDASQHSDIITILILGFCIDKKCVVAQPLKQWVRDIGTTDRRPGSSTKGSPKGSTETSV